MKLNPRTLLIGSILGVSAFAHGQTPPQFLTDAQTLISSLQASSHTAATWPNVYGTPASITWAGNQSTAKTECSSFVTLLWQHSLGWSPQTFKSWMGSTSPTALQYHDTIAAGSGFTSITNVSQIKPGQIIAIAYYPAPQSPTGHVMIVAGAPQTNSSKPLVTGTNQWTIPVIDSSSSYHGTTDTRYAHPGGIGQGLFRLYTHADGTIAGYTWSLLGTSTSDYYPQAITTTSGRHLAIGQLTKTSATP